MQRDIGRRRPARLKERRKRARRRRLVFLCAVGAIAGVAFVFLMRIEPLQISSVSIEGNDRIGTDAVREVVEEVLSGEYWYIVPRSNLILYPRSGIRTAIMERYPRIFSVALSYSGGSGILVSVRERTPHALWCGENLLDPLSVEGECFFLDASGFIFDSAPALSRQVYFRYYGPISRGRAVGSQFITAPEFAALDAFRSVVAAELPLEPVALAISGETEAEVYLAGGGKLIVPRGADMPALLDNLGAALSSDAFSGRDFSQLRYIDLRFGSNVYFRFDGGSGARARGE